MTDRKKHLCLDLKSQQSEIPAIFFPRELIQNMYNMRQRSLKQLGTNSCLSRAEKELSSAGERVARMTYF